MKFMTKFGICALSAALAMSCSFLVGCGEETPQDPTGSGEEQQQPQGKDALLIENMRTEFGYSEDFKTGGAFSVTLKKADGNERVLKESEYTVDSSAVQKGVPGTYSVKVTAEGLETSYPVKVLEKQKWEEDGVLKVFMIGNSFSVDAIAYAYNVAKDLGIKAVFANLAIGGCSIEQHIQYFSEGTNNYDYYLYSDEETWATQHHVAQEELQSDDWDFITIQSNGYSQGYASTYGNVQQLVDIINGWKKPETQIVWHMTWADQSDSKDASFKQLYGQDQMRQYNANVSAVQSEVVEKLGLPVLPCGTAVQNARGSVIGDVLTMDGHHLNSGIGRYVSGLTFVAYFSGKSVEGISWIPDDLKNKTALRAPAVESAMNAVKAPFELTPSKFTK